MVEFKTYDESKLDEQIELVKDVIKDWDWVIWYPNKKSLKESYSLENFTPETRHYVYDKKKLVGFLSSTVEREIDGILWGSIHIPFIRKDYEYIEKDLMNRTIELLKSKGVKAIRAIAMPGWGETIPILERLNFKERTLLSYVTLFNVNKFVTPGYIRPKQSIFDMEIENNFDFLIETISQINSQLVDRVRKKINDYQINNSLISSIVTKIGDNLAYGLIYVLTNYLEMPGRAFLEVQQLLNNGEDHSIKAVLYATIKYLAHKADQAGYSILWHEMRDINLLKDYEPLNLKFDPCYSYVLRID